MATVTAALRSAIVNTAVVSTRVYRRPNVPEGATMPYVTYDYTDGPAPHLYGDAGTSTYVKRADLQISLWQSSINPDDTYVQTIADALHGVKLVADNKVFGVRVTSISRLADPEPSILQDIILVRLWRS